MKNQIIIKNLGFQSYYNVVNKMNEFTKNRNKKSIDEIWFLEHPKIFTQGKSCKKYDNIICFNKIPIYKSNRGGKITYHGPGQQIIYFMIDIRRSFIKIKNLISFLENIIISTLLDLNIYSKKCNKFPGIYINKKKICFYGLQIIKGCSLYGLSLNVSMDIKPFSYINPCGYKKLKITQIKNFIKNVQIKKIRYLLLNKCLLFLRKNMYNKFYIKF